MNVVVVVSGDFGDHSFREEAWSVSCDKGEERLAIVDDGMEEYR